MKLHFLGAARQVTGSRYVLEVAGQQVMIDCGMFQERQYQSRNWDACPIPAGQIDAMLLTHVHIDHCGTIPRLVRQGFFGPIYTTPPSLALVDIMLRDAAEIQEEDIKYKKKRHRKEGRSSKYPYEPLFTVADVEKTLPLFQPIKYRQPLKVTPNVTATYFDAGHILGSAMIEIDATENGQTRKIIFSGDIGQSSKPLTNDPNLFEHADYVVMESTYGDRDHEKAGDIETQLARVVTETAARGGNVIIPTFAVERAQEVIYHLGRLVHTGRVPQLPVFLDSPMAVDVTGIFVRYAAYADEDVRKMIEAGQMPFRFPGLTMVRTAQESKAINAVRGPCIIMASSGMCTAGRIKHHLKQHIERPESTILFVGHQGEGTLGRQILDRNPRVRIHGEQFNLQARTAQIYGFSGHADRGGLMRWISNFKTPPRRVFFTHGEEPVSLMLAEQVQKTTGFATHVPMYQEAVELV